MKKIIALVCLCAFSFSYAAAEGYQVNSQSAKQAAMGHVGVSMKLGAESMHFNPAGLGFMNKTVDLSVGVFGMFTNVKYSKDSYTHKADNKVSTPLYLYGAFKINDKFAAGVSVTNPYGSSMNWGEDWEGAGLIQDIALKSFSVQPTISWKIMDRLSIGAGLSMVFGDFSLSRAMIAPGQLDALRPLTIAVPQLAPLVTPIINKYEDTSAASVTLSGDAGVKLGYNVGAMFDITDKLTVGVSYRSKVEMEVSEGTAEMKYKNEQELKGMLAVVNPVLQSVGKDPIVIPALDQGTFKASLPLPSNFNVGLTYKPNDRWLVSGEVQFVGWGAYDELDVNFYPQSTLGENDIKAPKNYHNTCIYRLGTQYAATKRLNVRLGAYYDETPVDDNYLNPETPSMNKLGLTTGLSFRPVQALSVDLGFSYVTGFGRDGSYPVKNADPFSGHYEVSAFVPTMGVAYSF